MCTTVEQEETKNENIAALTMKAKDAQKDVEELEFNFESKGTKRKNLSRFNDIITKLNAELADLKDKTEAGRRNCRKRPKTRKIQTTDARKSCEGV